MLPQICFCVWFISDFIYRDLGKTTLKVYILFHIFHPSIQYCSLFCIPSSMNSAVQGRSKGILPGSYPIPHHPHPHHPHLAPPVCLAVRLIFPECKCVKSWALQWLPNALKIKSHIPKAGPKTVHELALPGSSASFQITLPLVVCPITTLAFYFFKQAKSSAYTECLYMPV